MDADVTYRIDADGGILAGRVEVEPGAYRRAMPPEFTASLSSATADRPGGAVHLRRHPPRPGRRDPLAGDDGQQLRATRGGGRRARGRHRRGAGGRAAACSRARGERSTCAATSSQIERGRDRVQPRSEAKHSLNLLAGTRRSGYDITLRITGPRRRPPRDSDLRPAAGAARPDGAHHDRQHLELDEPGRARRRRRTRWSPPFRATSSAWPAGRSASTACGWASWSST